MVMTMRRTALLARSTGMCPVCGGDVQTTRSYNGHTLRDDYVCYRCGPTTYTLHMGLGSSMAARA